MICFYLYSKWYISERGHCYSLGCWIRIQEHLYLDLWHPQPFMESIRVYFETTWHLWHPQPFMESIRVYFETTMVDDIIFFQLTSFLPRNPSWFKHWLYQIPRLFICWSSVFFPESLTHWPLKKSIGKCNFKYILLDCRSIAILGMRFFQGILFTASQHQFRLPSGNKPLPDPVLTQIYILCHMVIFWHKVQRWLGTHKLHMV